MSPSRLLTASLLSALLLFPAFAGAQELHEDITGTWTARVVEVVYEEEKRVPGTEVRATYQTLRVEILEGPQKGEVVSVENDYFKLKQGETFFLSYLQPLDGPAIYTVGEPDRRGAVAITVLAFFALAVLIGGKAGARSVISLILSIAAIAFVLLPLIAAGYPPSLTSFGVAAIVLALAMLITHGWNRKSIAAYLGALMATLAVFLLGELAISFARISGFGSEEASVLNLRAGGTLDLSGIFLAAIVIGTLGILDDVTVTQASVVSALKAENASLSKKELYRKAMHVGQDHVGAVINTLALAYVGASLPLLLFFTLTPPSSLLELINRELFASELIRTAVGGMGLLLAAPLSTLLAVFLVRGDESGHHHPHG